MLPTSLSGGPPAEAAEPAALQKPSWTSAEVATSRRVARGAERAARAGGYVFVLCVCLFLLFVVSLFHHICVVSARRRISAGLVDCRVRTWLLAGENACP